MKKIIEGIYGMNGLIKIFAGNYEVKLSKFKNRLTELGMSEE